MTLNLSHRGLTQIPEIPSNITCLILSNNRLSHIRIDHLPELQVLILTGNQLTSLHAVGQLQELYLGDNQLTEFPSGQLSQLQKLYLGNNHLTRFPESISDHEVMINLQELYLRNNYLTYLPNSFGLLINLQELQLQDNDLEDLTVVGRLINLQSLDASNNRLQSLPDLGDLINLQILSLRNNQLGTLHDSIYTLPKLQTLNLKGNPIRFIPENLAGTGQDPSTLIWTYPGFVRPPQVQTLIF